ncbi:transmembrane and ubiquitin-like domain-containing protein 1 [Xenopus laevis]|uniref:Transmembrane and ubiquitin-like domain-containing protein 1 n=2 Tax=Xenopus laevis TaxID=8355 RepID=A0A1L8ES79_XENLA|nr:transmembrane and ubiquitin-like domain-containing protein 1 [Xenopus laevis]OCT62204.1 hypothetical protein XELAEV_18043288mg [Xenopus laevis]
MGMESPPPTMIEGLGDEVTVAVGLFTLLLAIMLAWLSTYVAEGTDPLLGSLMPAGRRDPLLVLSNPVPANPEPQRPVEAQAEKPEEGEQDPGGEQEAGSESANLDQMLDIQGVPKRSQAVGSLGEEEGTERDVAQEEDKQAEKPLVVGRKIEQEETKPLAKEEVNQEQTQPEEGLMTVRLKFLNETEEVAMVRPNDTIGMLKSKHFPGQEQQMKLIFQGQLLRDSSQTLCSLHITDNCVIHCHRSQATTPASSSSPESGGSSQEHTGLTPPIGNLMIPVFVVMLALIWYFRINYRQFFTAPATVSLVGVTVFFSFLVFGMYGR